jgi:flagellar hook-length control protein FliK
MTAIAAPDMTARFPTVDAAAAPVGEASAQDAPVADHRVSAEREVDRPEQFRQPPDPGRLMSRQIADAARHLVDRPVELQLNPEELGRVRMTLSRDDGSLSVTILAERGETLDLMRRHIDTLAQDFRDAGYGDINFDFGQQDDPAEEQAEISSRDGSYGAPEESVAPSPSGHRLILGSGLDIRL